MPDAVVVCTSLHHGNTAAVARAIAAILGAEVVGPESVAPTAVERCRLLGIGSGIYYGRPHETLLAWIDTLPPAPAAGRDAFVFTTSGLPFLSFLWHRPLTARLRRKGWRIVGEFSCRGHDTWGPLWLTGGINRRHPDARDLARAAEFARRLAAGQPSAATSSASGSRKSRRGG